MFGPILRTCGRIATAFLHGWCHYANPLVRFFIFSIEGRKWWNFPSLGGDVDLGRHIDFATKGESSASDFHLIQTKIAGWDPTVIFSPFIRRQPTVEKLRTRRAGISLVAADVCVCGRLTSSDLFAFDCLGPRCSFLSVRALKVSARGQHETVLPSTPVTNSRTEIFSSSSSERNQRQTRRQRPRRMYTLFFASQ